MRPAFAKKRTTEDSDEESRLLSDPAGLGGDAVQEPPDLGLAEPTVAAEGAKGGELPGVRPASDRLGVDVEQDRYLAGSQESILTRTGGVVGRGGVVKKTSGHVLLLSFGSPADHSRSRGFASPPFGGFALFADLLSMTHIGHICKMRA
jgi:hypothetical protein